MAQSVKITPTLSIGKGEPLLLIAGPCQIESLDICMKIAEKLLDIKEKYPLGIVFKASFDKANRTSVSSERGPGIDEGLNILAKIKESTNLPIITDIHLPEQASPVSEIADILQIPAFLCRQTDLLISAGKTGKTVNIKKGQFLPAADLKFSAEKVLSTNNDKILLCERGSCFGNRDLVVDMRDLVIMKELGFPVIYDATHSVQQLGGSDGVSGGFKEFITPLSYAATACGIDGIFIEAHPNPETAKSDAKSMLNLNNLEELIKKVCKINSVINET